MESRLPISVNFPRLQADIEALSMIGRREDHGLYRMAFSPEFMQACDWFAQQARQADLHVEVDGAMNVHARVGPRDAPDDGGLAAVMTGSHLDSVPGGGHLDGALGVVVGLECLRRFRELDVPLRRPLELVAFADEEGRFGGMFGSQALAGLLTPDLILSAQDLNGIKLCDAMASCGGEAMHALRARRAPQSLHAFVELHIEQGPVLDKEHVNIGVVEGIVGLRRWNCRLLGQANHAGTTPMDMRIDAFQGLAAVARLLPPVVEAAGSRHAVATIGRVSLGPGAANVIPGRAEFSLDMRDIDEMALARLAEAVRAMIARVARERQLMFEFDVVSEIDPVRSDPQIMDLIEDQARAMGQASHRLPSGAAHDTQMLARLTRVGMIFLPSVAGRSHSASEWTPWESIEAGANVLLRTLHSLATE